MIPQQEQVEKAGLEKVSGRDFGSRSEELLLGPPVTQVSPARSVVYFSRVTVLTCMHLVLHLFCLAQTWWKWRWREVAIKIHYYST